MTDEQNNQQELFAEYGHKTQKPERLSPLARPPKTFLVSATTEQLIFAGIIAILILCVAFFLGVLRGKSIKQPLLEAPGMSMPKQVPQPKIVQPKAILPQTAPRVVAALAAQPMPAKTYTQGADLGTVPVAKKFVVLDSTTGKKLYTIQLVTHKKKDMAEAEVQAIRKGGHFSFIIPSGDFYQVCTGQYASNEEARRDLAFFKSRYRDCFLRRR